MTRQLFDARAAVERNRAALENAKAYLESVLANMSAGVMVLDDEFRLVTSNQSVERILQQDVAPHIGQPLAAIEGLQGFSEVVTARLFRTERAIGRRQRARRRPALAAADRDPAPRRRRDDHDITLLARGSRLPVERGHRLHRGVRRYFGRDLGAALDRLGRSGAAPGA